MAWKLSNWAESTLSQLVVIADTTIYIDADDVDLLPTLGASDKAKAVIFDATYREIINITAWNTDGTLTVERAQESTTARDWPRGTKIIHTPTAAILQAVLNATSTVRFTGTATNIANAYTVDVGVGGTLPTFAEGEEVSFIIPADSTGAATLNVTDGTTSIGAKPISHQDLQALEDGDLQASWLAVVRYNVAADDWFLISQTSFNLHAYQVNDGPLAAVSRHPNGKLDYWRAATSFSSPASGTETADGWYPIYDGTIGTFTISRQSFTLGQTDVPGDPKYFLRWDHTAAGSGSTQRRLRVKLPGVHWRNGEKVTRSVWLKADSSRSVTQKVLQNFGTGGAPSSEVEVSTGTWNLTTSWAKFEVSPTLTSISGKTLGSGGDDCLYLCLDLPLNVTMTIDVAMDDIRPGHIAGLQSDTFPVPWWLGGTGGSYADQADFIADLTLFTVAGYPDLVAIEALASTGIAVRTGAATWAQRTLASAAAGLTWTNGDGVAGNPTPVFSTAIVNYLADPLSVGELASITAVFGTAAFKNEGAGSGLNADLLDSKNIGTSGNVVPLLDGANTWSAAQTLATGSDAYWTLNSGASTDAGHFFQRSGSNKWVVGRGVTTGGSDDYIAYSYGLGAIALRANYTTGVFAFTATPTVGANNVLTTATGAQLAAANTFTGGLQTISGATAGLIITETDAGTNEKDWLFYPEAGIFQFYCWNEAHGSATSIMSFARSGTTPTTITIGTAEIVAAKLTARISISTETTGTLTSASSNKTVNATGGVTINDGVHTAGDRIEIYAGSTARTITQDTGMTLRLDGTATTGNRTLAAYGRMSVYFNTNAEAICSGSGVS